MSQNVRINILSTGAFTSDQTTDPVTVIGNNLVVYLEVTAASGTGGLVVRIRGRTTNLTPFQLNQDPDPVTTTGIFAYYFAPGVFGPGHHTTNVIQMVRGPCPPIFDIVVHHLDGSSYTYKLDVTNS